MCVSVLWLLWYASQMLDVLTRVAFLLFWYRVLPDRLHLPLDVVERGRELICDKIPGLPVIPKAR